MFVDTHCHLTMLDLTPYNGDLDLALAAARAKVFLSLWQFQLTLMIILL